MITNQFLKDVKNMFPSAHEIVIDLDDGNILVKEYMWDKQVYKPLLIAKSIEELSRKVYQGQVYVKVFCNDFFYYEKATGVVYIQLDQVYIKNPDIAFNVLSKPFTHGLRISDDNKNIMPLDKIIALFPEWEPKLREAERFVISEATKENV